MATSPDAARPRTVTAPGQDSDPVALERPVYLVVVPGQHQKLSASRRAAMRPLARHIRTRRSVTTAMYQRGEGISNRVVFVYVRNVRVGDA